MSDIEERTISGHKVRIDRNRCIAEENCISIAPDVFELGEDQIVTFVIEPANVDHFLLREACHVCPVDALILVDEEGNQLVP